jgi:DNA-directed RNA polymerase specialized sigma24 family protein
MGKEVLEFGCLRFASGRQRLGRARGNLMRGSILLPKRTARRLDGRMAELDHGRRRFGRDQPPLDGYSPEQIADILMPRRDRLVNQVPRELAAARGLSRDQWEVAVDEAIDFLVTEFDKPLRDPESVEAVFWKAVSNRIKRLRAGRGATVRAGWRRVGLEHADLPSLDADPAEIAVHREEQATLLEFSATLTEGERQVLVCQYSGGERIRGRRVIARMLNMRIGEVRKHERNLTRKLERFVAVVAAGSLCAHRETQLAAIGSGLLSDEAERIARFHLMHCAACRAEHAAQLRAVRSGQLPREIANLLPGPVVVDTTRHRAGMWDWLPDWLTRPGAHEAASHGTQIGIASRGLGAAAAAKLAALCIGGVSVVGGGVYCLYSLPSSEPPIPKPTPRHETAQSTPRNAEPPDLGTGKILAAEARSTPTPTPTPTPKPRRKVESQKKVRKSQTPTSHERDGAISPAPPDAC